MSCSTMRACCPSEGFRPRQARARIWKGVARAAGIPTVLTVRTVEDFSTTVRDALDGTQLTTVIAKVEPTGPAGYVIDLSLVENRFQFRRYIQSLKRQ